MKRRYYMSCLGAALFGGCLGGESTEESVPPNPELSVLNPYPKFAFHIGADGVNPFRKLTIQVDTVTLQRQEGPPVRFEIGEVFDLSRLDDKSDFIVKDLTRVKAGTYLSSTVEVSLEEAILENGNRASVQLENTVSVPINEDLRQERFYRLRAGFEYEVSRLDGEYKMVAGNRRTIFRKE